MASGYFLMSQLFVPSSQTIGDSASVLQDWFELHQISISTSGMNIQNWFSLGLTGLIFLQSKGLSRVFSKTAVPKPSIVALSFLFGPTLTAIHDYWKNHSLTRQNFVCKVMSLLCHTLSRFVIAFLAWSKHLLISLLQSPSAVILEPKKINSVTVSPSICHEMMEQDAMI